MIRAREQDKHLILTVIEDRVDMVVARKFKELLSATLEHRPQVVLLNLAQVEYFDSSALGALVAFMREIKAYNGELRLCAINRSIMTLLKLSKLDALFEIFETEEEAMAE